MNYLQYTFQTAPENVDLLIAFLSDSPFDTFEETPDGFLAFAPASADEADIEAHLAELQEQFSFFFQKSIQMLSTISIPKVKIFHVFA